MGKSKKFFKWLDRADKDWILSSIKESRKKNKNMRLVIKLSVNKDKKKSARLTIKSNVWKIKQKKKKLKELGIKIRKSFYDRKRCKKKSCNTPRKQNKIHLTPKIK